MNTVHLHFHSLLDYDSVEKMERRNVQKSKKAKMLVFRGSAFGELSRASRFKSHKVRAEAHFRATTKTTTTTTTTTTMMTTTTTTTATTTVTTTATTMVPQPAQREGRREKARVVRSHPRRTSSQRSSPPEHHTQQRPLLPQAARKMHGAKRSTKQVEFARPGQGMMRRRRRNRRRTRRKRRRRKAAFVWCSEDVRGVVTRVSTPGGKGGGGLCC